MQEVLRLPMVVDSCKTSTISTGVLLLFPKFNANRKYCKSTLHDGLLRLGGTFLTSLGTLTTVAGSTVDIMERMQSVGAFTYNNL
jgi:hypothetical protein